MRKIIVTTAYILIIFINTFFLNGEGMKMSGFFDLNLSDLKIESTIFPIGEFEFNFEKVFSDRISIETAFVVDGEGKAEIAVGFINFQLTKSNIHLFLGKFDIPFGNDTNYYASIERTTLSPPLTTEFILDGGFNNIGINFYKKNNLYSFNMYAIRGKEEGIVSGGRIVFFPIKKKLSLGISYMNEIDKKNNRKNSYFALDAILKTDAFKIRWEYIRGNPNREINGFHFTGDYNLNKYNPYIRYDQIKIDKIRINRVSLGINIRISNMALLKIEYQHYKKNDLENLEDDSIIGQLVIAF